MLIEPLSQHHKFDSHVACKQQPRGLVTTWPCLDIIHKFASDLHPLDHSYGSTRVKHTPPSNTSHVVLARFDQLNLQQSN